MALITASKSALDVHIRGTIGKFRVSTEDKNYAGVDVNYVLTRVALSDVASDTKLLSMLAPVREVFDLSQLDFDEIMQRDIDDARVSLELIPYLLDTSTSGQIKLFPPIVAVAMPRKPTSRTPENLYHKVEYSTQASEEHKGITEKRITAGQIGEEQFEFFQLYQGDKALDDGAELRLSSSNSTLAIVDGQHRAMALLALFRNLSGGWSDSRVSPYEDYYKVWPEKLIKNYNLSELQLPLLICTFPQLDSETTAGTDVIKAARRVFLTLNKTAKRVSDSRNKLLNDQDIVADLLRTTLSHVKSLGLRDDTALRLWNVELDQEGDRVRIVSDAAFSGVSHLYHMIDNLMMAPQPARKIEARGKIGAPRKRLDQAYDRLNLKDELTQEQRDLNSKTNYSEDFAKHFRKKWEDLYIPIIDKIFAKFQPFSAFSLAGINIEHQLIARRDTVLSKMLFDGQSTARTFEEFHDGLERRISEPEWNTPEIKQTLINTSGVLNARKKAVSDLKELRAKYLLDGLVSSSKKIVMVNDVVVKPIRDAIDKIFDTVFNTIAFQTALVCTYAEAIKEVYKDVNSAPDGTLDEYLVGANSLFAPTNLDKLNDFLRIFEGEFSNDGGIKWIPGGPWTFRSVVLSGELQPAEWPKYRYLMLELWTPTEPDLKKWIEDDRRSLRSAVAKQFYKRRLNEFCEVNRLAAGDVSTEQEKTLKKGTIEIYTRFLSSITHKKVHLEESIFNDDGALPEQAEVSISEDEGSEE
jgi:hypothetical protein